MKGAAKMKENKTIKIITMITGILTVLLGFYAVVRPMRTFLAIGWILGVLEGLGGIILLFSGVQRFLTDIMATYLVGASVLVYGIFQIVAGVKKFKDSKGKAILAIVCGVLSIIVSIIAFTHPVLTMFSVGYMIAFAVLMQGINMIVLAVNFGKESE